MAKEKLRSIFAAQKGNILLAADLSQAETWIVAYDANCPAMKRSLTGGDIHTDTAFGLFREPSGCLHEWQLEGKSKHCLLCGETILETERYVGKQNNHANSYGMKKERQAQVINKQSDKPPYVTVSIKECGRYQKLWHGLYPEIKLWHYDIQEKLKYDRQLTTCYGFTRTFYGYLDDQLYKKAYAFKPQSGVCSHFAGEEQKENPVRGGLKAIYEDLCRHDIVMRNMSHDSLVLELPNFLVDEIAPQVKQYLERPIILNHEMFTIPADVEVGFNYGAMKGWTANSQ